MKKQKAILLAVILLLCFIVISVMINQKRNIKKEQITIKEMSETTQVSDLQEQINQLNASHTEYANYVQSYKQAIATAITNQGVNTSADSTAEVMSENIGKILQAKTTATATAAQILTGKTAWVNGSKVTGTMANNGALNWAPTTSTKKTVAAGYYSGGMLDSSGAYTAGYNAASSANDVKVISLVIENLGTKWHSEYSYNIGTGKKNVYVVLKNFRTSLPDCDMRLTQSYNSSTGIVSWNYQAESEPGKGDFTLKGCRGVVVDIIYQ